MSRPARSFAAFVCFVSSLLLLAAGCGRSRLAAPTSPASAGAAVSSALGRPADAPAEGAGFYPLDLGDRWHYAGRAVFTEVVAGEPSNILYDEARSVDGENVCVESLLGRDYVIEQRITHSAGSDYAEYLRNREDSSGLYEADVAINTAPACVADGAVAVRAAVPSSSVPPRLDLRPLSPARRLRVEAAAREVERRLGPLRAILPIAVASARPGGVAAGEITRLRYPLHRGQRWVVRDDPGFLFESWDDGMTVLDTPAGRLPAHRVRVNSSLFGPDDFVELLYGRSGYLGLNVHLRTPETDESGNVVGTVLYDDVLRIVSLSLASHGPR